VQIQLVYSENILLGTLPGEWKPKTTFSPFFYNEVTSIFLLEYFQIFEVSEEKMLDKLI
jgi:hypothetical protein